MDNMDRLHDDCAVWLMDNAVSGNLAVRVVTWGNMVPGVGGAVWPPSVEKGEGVNCQLYS